MCTLTKMDFVFFTEIHVADKCNDGGWTSLNETRLAKLTSCEFHVRHGVPRMFRIPRRDNFARHVPLNDYSLKVKNFLIQEEPYSRNCGLSAFSLRYKSAFNPTLGQSECPIFVSIRLIWGFRIAPSLEFGPPEAPGWLQFWITW